MTAWKKRRLERENQLEAQRIARFNLHCKFAAAALAGITGHPTGPVKRGYETGPEAHARWAWQVADCMMKAGDA